MGLFDSTNSDGFSSTGNYNLDSGGLGYQQAVPSLPGLTNTASGVAATGAGAGSLLDRLLNMDTWLGGTNSQTGIKSTGLAMPLIAGGSSILQGLLGMQQYGLAKDQFKEQQRQYDQNYAAQVKTTNTQLEDRQRARVASNPGAYQSVSDYLAQNKVG